MLRTKIIAWSFVPSAIILLAVALVTFYAYQKVTEDLVLGRNPELTRLTAAQLAADLADHAGLLAALARNPDLHGGDPPTQRGALARARGQLLTFDAGTVVLDIQGRLVAAEPERPDALGQDWSDRAYFRQLLRSSGPVFSDILTDGPGGAEVIVVAVPLVGSRGEFRGSLAGMFRLGATAVSAFYGAFVKLRPGESGSLYLVDSTGRVVYHSNADRIGQDFARREVVQGALGRKASRPLLRGSDGEDTLASFAPVPGTPWYLVVEESWSALMDASQGYRRFLLLLLALGVMVPALVVTVGVRRITGPIAELIHAAQEVAGGNFGRPILVRTGDELEELAKQFNLMSAQLQESYADLERKVAGRTRELATLNAVAAVVSRSLELEEIMGSALDKTLETMEADVGGIYLLDREARVLKLVAWRGLTSEFAAGIDRLQVGEGFSGRVALSGEPLVVRDLIADPLLTRQVVRELGHASLACVPLSARGNALGTLFAIVRDPREFTSQEVQLLRSIGHQIGVAVENARLFAAEQRRAEQFRVIGEMGHRITSLLAVDRLLEEIVRLVREALGYSMVGIGLMEGGEVVFKAGFGSRLETPGLPTVRLKPEEESITGWVVRTGEPLLVPDVSQDPRYYLPPYLPEAAATRSELAVPLKTREAVIGVLDVQSERLNAFDESDVAVLQSLAHQAAVAIENARLYERAQQLAVMEERNRLARDLHDSVTQAVYGVTLYAEAAARLLYAGQPEPAADHLRELRATAQQALREMRSLIFELRPPALEKEGLVAALQTRLEAVEARSGVQTELAVEGEIHLSPDIEEALYRIAQEALNNSLKHAGARRVRVFLSVGGGTTILEVADDGAGFDPTAVRERGGMGLRSMEERAALLGGRLEVASKPGEGTTVRVEIGVR